MKSNQPPKVFIKLFRWYCHPKLVDHIEGDLIEVYQQRLDKLGKRKADIRFMIDVLLLFRPRIIKPVEGYQKLNTYGMYKSYFRIGWRNLLRSKGYSLINIGGLAVGMAVAILIGLWVYDELSFNKSFAHYSRIAKVYHHLTFGEEAFTLDAVPHAIGAHLKNNFAEFEDVVIVNEQGEHVVGYEEKAFSKVGIYAEPHFLEMFSVPMLKGTHAALKDVNSIVLSKALADVLVGDNAIGKVIKFNNKDNLMVAGVYEDFPDNSQFEEIKFILPMDYFFAQDEANQKLRNNWESYDFGCFVLLDSKASIDQVSAKVKNVLFQNASGDGKSIKPEGFLFPMEKWHLHAEFKNGQAVGGKIQFVWMFGIIGIFVLLLACINFMNLSTARSEKRSKEVGIRKVMGSVRNQLVSQFMSESLLVVMLAFLFATVMVAFSLPWFNDLASKKMTIPWRHSSFVLISLAFVILTSLLAGSYPALYLSSFHPIKVLKGAFKAGRLATVPRKVMVVFQFTISIALIIGTVVVYQQIQHAKDRPTGFDREGIIHLQIRTEDLAKTNYNTLRHELLSTGVVENIAKSDFPITGAMAADASLSWEGKDPAFRPMVALNSCSHDFPNTSGFEFLEGRDFSRELSTDSSAIIVNEIFAKLLSDKSVIGKTIQFGYSKKRHIIGVIKDQVRWTPFSKQSPHIYCLKYIDKGYLTVKLKPSVATRTALDKIDAVIKKHDPGAPFDYKFVDDDYGRLFKDEERIGKIASVFAVLAIFISCLGIFGLASFTASQRIKEIGIRKILGASIFTLWKMLSRDFVWLVVISILVAAPLAYYFANRWLQQYDYHIEIAWWIFAATAMGALTITLLTVSYQSIKAALANPVDSLRSE